MKSLGRIGLAGLAVAAALAPSISRADTELRIATLAPAGSPWMSELDKSSNEITEKTGKRVRLKYFEGGQQGDERDFVDKIKIGQLDGAAVTSIGLAMIDESIRVLELPMMFETVEEVDYVADKMWPYFQKKFEKKGFRLNERSDVGWIYFLSKSKISTVADLKAAKIWQWGDDKLVGAMFGKLGLNGVKLGVPEVDPSLTSGRINACYGSPVAAVALQWYSKVKYMTNMPMSFAIGATVVSLEAIKKMSAEDAKVVDEIGKQAAKKLRKVIRRANEDAAATMVKKGITRVDVSKEMVDEFTKTAATVQAELANKVYSKEELDMVIKYRDEYRAKKKKK
jgi:TRAP-type transport system periplasmic protein